MEHVTIKNISSKIKKLIPDEGYILYNKVTQSEYSEAVVNIKNINKFIAIEINY